MPLRAELFFCLSADPQCSVTHGMQIRIETESRLVNAFLKFRTEFKRRFSRNIRKAQARLFPNVFLPLRRNGRHHAAVRFGNHTISTGYRLIFLNALVSTSVVYIEHDSA